MSQAYQVHEPREFFSERDQYFVIRLISHLLLNSREFETEMKFPLLLVGAVAAGIVISAIAGYVLPR